MKVLKVMAAVLGLALTALVLFSEFKPEWLAAGLERVPPAGRWFYAHFK